MLEVEHSWTAAGRRGVLLAADALAREQERPAGTSNLPVMTGGWRRALAATVPAGALVAALGWGTPVPVPVPPPTTTSVPPADEAVRPGPVATTVPLVRAPRPTASPTATPALVPRTVGPVEAPSPHAEPAVSPEPLPAREEQPPSLEDCLAELLDAPDLSCGER